MHQPSLKPEAVVTSSRSPATRNIVSDAKMPESTAFDLNIVRQRVMDYITTNLLLSPDLPGQYKIEPNQPEASLYASTDVVIARAIMGEDLKVSLSETDRQAWIQHIQSFTRPDGGYTDTFGHSQLHAHGMVIGALGVLGGTLRYSTQALYDPFREVRDMREYLANEIDWVNQWTSSHQFWGGLHMFAASSMRPDGWIDAVFDWLDARIDPQTGWFGYPAKPTDDAQALGGAAHIWPIYEHENRPFPCPERVIDRILLMQHSCGNFHGHSVGSYLNLDALYGLKLMRKLTPNYREADCMRTVMKHAHFLIKGLDSYFQQQPHAHSVLALVGNFGLLQQLAPQQFIDTKAAIWSDIFTDSRLYLTAEVEVDA